MMTGRHSTSLDTTRNGTYARERLTRFRRCAANRAGARF